MVAVCTSWSFWRIRGSFLLGHWSFAIIFGHKFKATENYIVSAAAVMIRIIRLHTFILFKIQAFESMTMVQTSPAYSLLDNDKLKAIKPKKIAFLAGVFTCLLMIAITNQMSSLLGESSGIYGHLRNSSRIDGVETDDDMNQNKTIEFTGIENAEWCLGKSERKNIPLTILHTLLHSARCMN